MTHIITGFVEQLVQDSTENASAQYVIARLCKLAKNGM